MWEREGGEVGKRGRRRGGQEGKVERGEGGVGVMELTCRTIYGEERTANDWAMH